MTHDWKLELYVNTPTGVVPLTDRIARVPLPRGPEGDALLLHYGPYLRALSHFLTKENGAHFHQALRNHPERSVTPGEIRSASLISEKHGALYQVARLIVDLATSRVSLAVNVAVTPVQKAFLEGEFHLLQGLSGRTSFPYLPHPILCGETVYNDASTGPRVLTLFLVDWFEGFHEFHLSRQPQAASGFGIKVWDNESSERFLSNREEQALYREAATILTAYLNTDSFEQIYPWHNAAGDFVASPNGDVLKVRLITARGYRALGDFPSSDESVVIAALHFLLNTSLRLRLDRLDGTGELVWADRESLEGILAGFLNGWHDKWAADKTLPSTHHLLDLLSRFTQEDWMSFGALVLEDGMVEREETAYLREHLESHVLELAEVIHRSLHPHR
jgi:hypothetical protein